MRTAHKWYHCRACGEEALEADEERCPHCGILRPVILCDCCARPILREPPWVLRHTRISRPDEIYDEATLHRSCYAYRKFMEGWFDIGAIWITLPDRRDRLTPVRILIGVGFLTATLLIFAWFLKYAPKPTEGTFSSNVLKHYIKYPQYNQPSPMELMRVGNG